MRTILNLAQALVKKSEYAAEWPLAGKWLSDALKREGMFYSSAGALFSAGEQNGRAFSHLRLEHC